MAEFHQTYQIQIFSNQQQGFMDVPTRDPRQLQLANVTPMATHAVTNAVVGGIQTILQSNAFIVKAVNGKPDVLLAPGATLRIIAARTVQSPDPIRVVVEVDFVEV